jgi:DNA-binding CsgD family transcriptional regulator
LEAKGLVVRVADTPERFEAVDPAVALEALVLTAEEQLNKVREQVRQLTELYRSAHRVDIGRSVVELVTGSQAMRQRVVQVQRSAREELRCLDRPPYVDSRGTTEIALELLAREVACRTIYARDAVEQPGTLADIEQLALVGEQARVLPTVPLKLYLVDDRLALLAIQRRPTDIDAALVIHSSGLLDALSSLFESLWRRAIPFDLAVHPAPEDAGRTAQPDQRRLIALLLSGLTDQAIARQLRVGYRTVQRRLAELMDELGASTRFQAGVQAALLARARKTAHPPAEAKRSSAL